MGREQLQGTEGETENNLQKQRGIMVRKESQVTKGERETVM
jgi:hypothetical protein